MAETNGLLNRRTGKSGTEGSNPSVSAIASCNQEVFHQTALAHHQSHEIFAQRTKLGKAGADVTGKAALHELYDELCSGDNVAGKDAILVVIRARPTFEKN